MTAGIGLDIGATKTLGVVVDEHGAIRASVRRPTAPGAEGVVATAAEVVDALRAQVPEAASRRRSASAMPGSGRRATPARSSTPSTSMSTVTGCPSAGCSPSSDRRARPASRTTSTPPPSAPSRSAAPTTSSTSASARAWPPGWSSTGACGAATTAPPARSATCRSTRPGCCAAAASGAAWRPSPRARRSRPRGRAATCPPPRRSSPRRPPVIARRSRSATGSPPGWPTPSGCSASPSTRAPSCSAAASPSSASRCSTRCPRPCAQQAAASPFLASLDLAGRLRVVPVDHPVAAVGAALLGGRRCPCR